MKKLVFIFEGISRYDYDDLYMLKSLENRSDVVFQIWIYCNYKQYLKQDYLYNVSNKNILNITELYTRLSELDSTSTMIITSICRGISKGGIAFYRAVSNCGVPYGAFSHIPYVYYGIDTAMKDYVGATHYSLALNNLVYDIKRIKNKAHMQRMWCNIISNFPKMLGIRKMDFIIVSGRMSETCYLQFPTDKKTKRIKTHCNDTEKFILDKTRNDNKICTFIDTNFFFGIDVDAETKKYFLKNKDEYGKKFCRLFDRIEKELNCSVVIAAHPRLVMEQLVFLKKLYGNRRIEQGKTIELVKQSRFIMITSTSALKYAILANKPIHTIMTSEIGQTYFAEQVYKQSRLLGKEPINIDKAQEIDINLFLKYDKVRYKKLAEDFCMDDFGNQHLFWDEVLEQL